MKYPLLALYLLLSALLTAQGSVTLTGIIDGDLSGGTPKAIELYVSGTVDLSGYTIERYSNANVTPNLSIQLAGSYTDAYVYLTDDAPEFASLFGSEGDFGNLIDVNVGGNGNDAFTLLAGEVVVDQTGGVIGDDGNLYQDSYLYRVDGTGPDGAWVAENWLTPGNGTLDGLTAEEQGAAVPFGIYQPGGGSQGPTITVTAIADAAEPDQVGRFDITLSEAANQDFTFTYELSGTATRSVDYSVDNYGQLTILVGTTQTELLIDPIDDTLPEGVETIEFNFTSLSDSTYRAGEGATISLVDDDLEGIVVGIHTVQGSGETSPLAGSTVTVQGIVTGDFQDGLSGFYLQEEDADTDQDSTTSEGIFVFAPDVDVTLGDLITVTAEVEERFGQTQLRGADAGANITVDAPARPLPTAYVLRYPRADTSLEKLEGMRVAPVDLVITDVSNLARFGELTASPGERIVQFTECNEPDAEAFAAYQAGLADDELLIDDGRSGRDLSPILLPGGDTLGVDSQVRAGQTISGLIGVLGYGFNRYRLQPTPPPSMQNPSDGVTYAGNERPTEAPAVGGSLKIVSANVLNYFTTLGSRGADTEVELLRQEAKIVAALTELDGDIVGLIEIENNDNVALSRLTAALSIASGHPYLYVTSPNTGTDAIKVALIYRSDRVEESGTAAALTEPADLFMERSTNRVPLAQTFRIINPDAGTVGEELTVCVNHLKSKGGGCGPGNDDDGGAGNCNGTRAGGARAIVDWLATNPTGVEEDDVMIIGDLNAYRMEEPIKIFTEAGYFNTKTLAVSGDKFPCGGGPPSYVFGGQWGSLDYALASPSMASKVTGATAWQVNAPEPAVLDYNTEGVSDTLYAPDFYRFSDHDPIVVGLDYNLIIDNVSSSAPTDSPVQLQRLNDSSYTFLNVTRRARYLVTNVSGQVLQRGRVTTDGGRVELGGLPAGVYFIVLREPGVGQATFKVLR